MYSANADPIKLSFSCKMDNELFHCLKLENIKCIETIMGAVMVK